LESAIQATKAPQTYALDRAAGIGKSILIRLENQVIQQTSVEHTPTYGDAFGFLPQIFISEINFVLLLNNFDSWTWDVYEITVSILI
jgi:hypothetical protein